VAQAHAGAHRLDHRVGGVDRHLGAVAGLPGDRLDLHDALADLRDFELKQALDEPLMGPGDQHLRPAAELGDLQHVDLQAVIDVVLLAGHLLALLQQRLCAAQLDIDLAVVHPLHDGGEDFIFLFDELVVDHAALGFADVLHDHLLRGLRCDSPEIPGRGAQLGQVADFIPGVDGAGLFEADFGLRVLDHLDDGLARENLHRPLFAVDRRADVGALAEILFIRGDQCGFDGGEEHILVDAALLGQRVQRADKFAAVNVSRHSCTLLNDQKIARCALTLRPLGHPRRNQSRV